MAAAVQCSSSCQERTGLAVGDCTAAMVAAGLVVVETAAVDWAA
jgi:hypothetical protein